MSKPIRVCFWATTFQSDLYAVADAMTLDGRYQVTVAMKGVTKWLSQPIARLRPFAGRLLEQAQLLAARERDFDLVVIDNHPPPTRLGERILVLWHGYGWRFDDLSALRRKLGKLVGATNAPNPRFRWNAVGPIDYQYRTQHSRFHRDNVVTLGSPFSDLLLPGTPERPSTIDPAWIAPLDPTKQTVLVAVTWHHGGLFSGWGSDDDGLMDLFDVVQKAHGQVIVRLHDRHRYTRSYRRSIARLAAKYPSAVFKYKSEAPDCLVDLWCARVIVSDYSSILNSFYYTKQTALHIDPRNDRDETKHCTLLFGRPRRTTRRSRDVWKVSPADIGGIRIDSMPQLRATLSSALCNPSLGSPAAAEYIARHISNVNGQSRQRVLDYVFGWLHPEHESCVGAGQEP